MGTRCFPVKTCSSRSFSQALLRRRRFRSLKAMSNRIRPTSLSKMSDEDIAFLSVRELGHLVRTKQLSPVRLTDIYLGRLKQYGERLLCVVTLTEERARAAAKKAEQEINAGHYRGPLHGIPYGI